MGVQPAIINGGATLIGPTADGSDGDVMETDGAGNLLFVTPGGGGGLADAHALIAQGIVKFVKYSMNDFTATATGGTGGSSQTARKLDIFTGTTSSSYKSMEPDGGPAESIGNDRDELDWAKKITFATSLTQVNNTGNGQVWIGLGTQNGVDVGSDPISEWAGFRIDGTAIKGIVLRLSGSLDVVDLSSSVSTSTSPQLVMVLDGSGNAEWFVNGVSKGTSIVAPTGQVTSAHTIAAIANNADSAQHRVYIHNVDWAATV